VGKFQEPMTREPIPATRCPGFPRTRLRDLWTLALLWSLGFGPGSLAQTPGFSLPEPGRVFQFPRDHGSHPDFAIEWWYVTGHLDAADGGRLGFQATFFRRSAPRSGGPAPGAAEAAFSHDELHLAHMALLDAATGTFIHEERLNRRGWDADSATNTLDVRNGNWSLALLGAPVGPHAQRGSEKAAQEPLLLQGGIRAEASWRMVLTPEKPLVVFGTNGVSRKAAEPSAASHYLTWPRLRIEGELTAGGRTRAVAGTAWMDHEISSSQLGEGQVGWDWACIQLNDGRELMAYRMRRKDGSTDPFSTLAWIDRGGRVRHWDASGFQWTPEGTWRSPRTGAAYPSLVRLTVPDPAGVGPISYRLRPLAADQELSGGVGGIPYWEGACDVLDATGRIVGRAFLEMTGYAGELRRAL